MNKELVYYKTKKGEAPLIEWLGKLKDKVAKAKIQSRLTRLSLGNAGDSEPIGQGMSELRIHYGPGFRVYYIETHKTVILLLAGGTKKTQSKDIERAKTYLTDFKVRQHEKS